MNLTKYIPAGRTSLVNKNGGELQIQTEYAYRPFARLTTTIIHNGQVLHKIEKKLEKPIESFEEQSLMENRIMKQHNEVVSIIKDNDTSSLFKKSDSQKIPIVAVDEQNIVGSVDEIVPVIQEVIEPGKPTLIDKFKSINGVKYVYHLNIDGEFVSKVESEHFKKSYSAIFNSISELMEIFTLIPGISFSREAGVYEVERNKLFLVSAGEDIYFVLLQNASSDINYEKVFKDIVKPSYF